MLIIVTVIFLNILKSYKRYKGPWAPILLRRA